LLSLDYAIDDGSGHHIPARVAARSRELEAVG
jgi:hypothetical protein